MNASLKEVIDSLTIKGFALKINNPEIDNPIAAIFIDENDQSHFYLIRFNVDENVTSDGTWVNKRSRDLVLNNLLFLHFLRTLNELPSLKEKVASSLTSALEELTGYNLYNILPNFSFNKILPKSKMVALMVDTIIYHDGESKNKKSESFATIYRTKENVFGHHTCSYICTKGIVTKSNEDEKVFSKEDTFGGNLVDILKNYSFQFEGDENWCARFCKEYLTT